MDGPLVTLLIADLPGAAVRPRGAGDEEAAAVENTEDARGAGPRRAGTAGPVQAVVMAYETGLVAPEG